MSTSSVNVTVLENGDLRFIYHDEIASLLSHGNATIHRASHVEPSGTGWTADMSPVDGPVLGPFARRHDALTAEVAWLQHNRNL